MSQPTVLVLNCGSSSLKFALMVPSSGARLIGGLAERLGTASATLRWQGEAAEEALGGGDHAAALAHVLDHLTQRGLLDERLIAVGHRVVHGGETFTASTRLTAEVIAAIERCNHLAPLHNPANLLGIRVAQQLLPHLPHIAVFDTAFHQTLQPRAYLYAIPYALYRDHAVRRYGFHGTSHRYVTERAAEILQKPLAQTSLLSAHLGNGCSATAVLGGRSVDSTMGLTPLEGLVMGTRSGDVDPSLHSFLQDELGYTLDETTTMLNKQSGLLGLSELSNDMRTLLEAAANGHEQAALAIEVFCYRLAKALAALTVPLGRLDALIFTGGIGEHAAEIRAKTLAHLGHLNFNLDTAQNKQHGRHSNHHITLPTSTPALVIPTDEERMIAEDSAALVIQKE